MLTIFISIVSTFTTLGQTSNKRDSIKPLRQLTPKTYEIHVDDIRTANQIFIEHASLKQQIDTVLSKNKDLQKINKIQKVEIRSLEASVSDLKGIVTASKQQNTIKDTYHKSQLSTYRRQRNTAYIVGISATVLSILLITK